MVQPVADQDPVAVFDETARLWRDEQGRLGPVRPGVGPRQDPVGEFPTGPEIGTQLPEIIATSHDGQTIDVHANRAGRPAVIVFHRSAVW